MDVSLSGVLMAGIVVGAVFIFIGLGIKYFYRDEMANFYNEKNKNIYKFAKITSKNLVIIGIIIILITMSSLFLNKSRYIYVMKFQVIAIVLGIIKASYEFYRYQKVDRRS